ncbi:hypothetical protein MMC30_006459 [Trapelia coarctata]|nr:hypothetical protein [Trapelia coarctata]
MDVVSFVFAALGFVNQAINTGTVLRKLVQDYPTVGNTIVNAIVRLEAQKYTLELWHSIWTEKAIHKYLTSVSTEESLKQLWGNQGILASIDPASVGSIAHLQRTPGARSDPGSDGSSTPLQTTPGANSDLTSQASLPGSVSGTLSLRPPEDHLLKRSSSRTKIKRWYHLLTSSTASLSIDSTSRATTLAEKLFTAAQERAQAASDALQVSMTPGTKFKWSLSLKDDLRLRLGELDDWLTRLQKLAESCEERQTMLQSESITSVSSSVIRNAAKTLYSAVLGKAGGQDKHRIGLKLEREHTRPEYFDGLLGPVSYIDETGQLLKFPLVVTDSLDARGASLLSLRVFDGRPLQSSFDH